jgi:NAD(P)-dependent dehydrogenase (short-subunit alcohol dehydrogenase family)
MRAISRLEVLTRYLAKKLGARGMVVTTVAPGAIASNFSGGMVRDNPDLNKRFADMRALGRVGQPDDIGPMIASLLFEDNRWVNAKRIEASGGMVSRIRRADSKKRTQKGNEHAKHREKSCARHGSEQRDRI